MRLRSIIVVLLLVLSGCNEDKATGAINSCKANAYARHNPKDLAQCIAVCQRCDGGTPISCSMICNLKGAR